MSSDYLLRIIFRNRAIVRFAGSNLVKTRRDAIELAADYIRTHPIEAQAIDLSFQVVDEAGRLLLVLPVGLVASKAENAADLQADLPPIKEPSTWLFDQPASL